MQDRTGLTVFLVRVVFVLFETRRFCKVARFVFPDLRIDRLSAMIDGIFGDGAVPPKEDVYLCDSEVACMLKVSRRTLGEYRSNGTLPYYVLGGKVLYKRSEIEQVLEREYRSVGKARGSG